MCSRLHCAPTWFQWPARSEEFWNTQSPTSEAHEWSYDETPDRMGRGTIKEASITSANTISLGFPYEGEQHARLMLRVHPQYGKDLILSVEKGQFLTGVYGCKVLIRFDDEKPLTFSARGPADNSTTTLFIDGYSKLVPRLKRAKTFMIEAPFYQEGNQVFEFNVEGLKWEESKITK